MGCRPHSEGCERGPCWCSERSNDECKSAARSSVLPWWIFFPCLSFPLWQVEETSFQSTCSNDPRRGHVSLHRLQGYWILLGWTVSCFLMGLHAMTVSSWVCSCQIQLVALLGLLSVPISSLPITSNISSPAQHLPQYLLYHICITSTKIIHINLLFSLCYLSSSNPLLLCALSISRHNKFYFEIV